MEVLKLYVVLVSVFATALGCDLQETALETLAKDAVEANITSRLSGIDSTYRLRYHVAPPVGWMNDPNGFSYYQGNFHLFYQFYPFATSTGSIHWGHVISQDLVTWTQKRIALLPEREQCFSGSAIEKDGTLVLMYTAHMTNSDGSVNETQYLAFSNDGVIFNKYKAKNPVISFTPDNSHDFRDPKVWKRGNYYYVVTGSQTVNQRGRVLMYRSLDMGFWEFFSQVGISNGDLGYMWECPDFFELGGTFVLLMSPQGIPAANRTGDRYQNQHQTGYIMGSFNYETGQFIQTVPFQEIDYGHDFYATQTMEKDGHRYLIAWMGSWDGVFTERSGGWAGAMTIVRELTLSGDRILMKPVEAITGLRDTVLHNGTLAASAAITTFAQTGELIVTFDMTRDLSLSIKGSSDTKLVTLEWNTATRKISLDRGVTTADVRQAEWTPVSSRSLRIFLDASSIEVFCGEGEMVFSSRVYPTGTWQVTNSATQDITVVAFSLKRSVPA